MQATLELQKKHILIKMKSMSTVVGGMFRLVATFLEMCATLQSARVRIMCKRFQCMGVQSARVCKLRGFTKICQFTMYGTCRLNSWQVHDMYELTKCASLLRAQVYRRRVYRMH